MADLVPQQASDNGADDGAGLLVLVRQEHGSAGQ